VEWFDTKRRSNRYHKISNRFLPTEEELAVQRTTHFSYEPLISIVVPAYETDPVFLNQLIDTVLEQSYSKLELCIADGSKTDIVRTTLQEYTDSRIQYIKLSKNAGISENTNEGFQNAHGEYIALLDHDDLLTKNALFEMVQVLNTVSPRLFTVSYRSLSSEEVNVTLPPVTING
jgi:glycosyltransferase involved in cell wall biosynthesis